MTYAQRLAQELDGLIESARTVLDEVERLGDDAPLALKSAWGALHGALVPFGVVDPLPGPPEPQSACKGFQWIGQSWEHCNGCSRPCWEHEGFEEVGADSPFGDGAAKIVPWTGPMAEAREKYLAGMRITVHGTGFERRVIVYSKK